VIVPAKAAQVLGRYHRACKAPRTKAA